jgi:YVTN family beta-propeller protein
MESLKGKGIKNGLYVFSAIIIVFIMLSQVAFSSVNESSITSKTTMGKIANVNDITPFVKPTYASAGYVKYTLFLLNNTLLKGNVIGAGNGAGPDAVAYDSANNYIYIANKGSNEVSVINCTTNSVIASISVGSWPEAVTYDSASNYLYVANWESSNVSVINGANNSVIATISEGTSWPDAIAYDPSNNYLYVAYGYHPHFVGQFAPLTVSVINCASNSVISSISVGGRRSYPDAIAYDSSNNYIYVANSLSYNVSVINAATNSVISSINVGHSPVGVAYDSGNNYIYVTNYGQNNVSVINGATNSVIASINVGSGPDAVAYDSFYNYIYIANVGSSSISIISPYENFNYIWIIAITIIVLAFVIIVVALLESARAYKRWT